MKTRIFVILIVAILLHACTAYQAIDPTKSVAVGDGLVIRPQIAWAKASGVGIAGTVWTVDGVGLNDLRFFTDIKKGAPLLDIEGVSRREVPAYDPSMLPDDVMELTVSTFSKLGYSQVKGSAIRPVLVGGIQGFRFDLQFSRDDLLMKGVAMGVQRASKLDLIVYCAPQEYYFAKYQSVVEGLLSTVSFETVK